MHNASKYRDHTRRKQFLSSHIKKCLSALSKQGHPSANYMHSKVAISP